jgi:hypothetical protein
MAPALTAPLYSMFLLFKPCQARSGLLLCKGLLMLVDFYLPMWKITCVLTGKHFFFEKRTIKPKLFPIGPDKKDI